MARRYRGSTHSMASIAGIFTTLSTTQLSRINGWNYTCVRSKKCFTLDGEIRPVNWHEFNPLESIGQLHFLRQPIASCNSTEMSLRWSGNAIIMTQSKFGSNENLTCYTLLRKVDPKLNFPSSPTDTDMCTTILATHCHAMAQLISFSLILSVPRHLTIFCRIQEKNKHKTK